MLRNHLLIVVFELFLAVSIIHCAPRWNQQNSSSPSAPHYASDNSTTPIPIITQTVDNSPDGSFNYSYETGNGIKQQSSGFHKTIFVPRLRSDGSETDEQEAADILVQTGSFSYTAPDGSIISLTYISDENGFQPIGDHLPTSPPIPEQILRSLEKQNIQQPEQFNSQQQQRQQQQDQPQQDQQQQQQPQQQQKQRRQRQQSQNGFGF